MSSLDRPISEECQKLHQQACEQGKEFYIDPESGLLVLTRAYHEKRGYCCESGCRHCPYGFIKEVSKE